MKEKNHVMHFGAVAFGIAIVAGCTQYLSTIALEQYLAKELFSQISVILGYFATYLLLLDLGIQEELVRRLQHGEEIAAHIGLRLRLIGATVAFIALLINSHLAGVSAEVFWGTFSFALCFFPAAFLYTNEARAYITRHAMGAGGQRLARALALTLVVAILLWWRPVKMTAFNFVVVFSFFPVCFVVVAWVLWKPVHHHASADSIRQSTYAFVKDTWHLMVARILSWAFLGLFYHCSIAIAGESHLAEFTMGMVLTVPIGILLQVYSQLYFAQSGSSKSGNQRGRLTVIVLLTSIAYGLLISLPVVHRWSFTNIDYTRLMLFFWPFLFAVLFGGASLIMIIDAGAGQARRLAAVVNPLISTLCMGVVIAMVPSRFDFVYIGFGWLLAVVLGTFTTFILLRRHN